MRYALSGAFAFAGDLVVFFALTEQFAIHYLLANVAGYATGLVISYVMNIKWVFRHRVYDDAVGQEATLFLVIVVTALSISELALYLAVEEAGVHYGYAKLVAAFFVFMFNYIAKKYILFSPRKESS